MSRSSPAARPSPLGTGLAPLASVSRLILRAALVEDRQPPLPLGHRPVGVIAAAARLGLGLRDGREGWLCRESAGQAALPVLSAS